MVSQGVKGLLIEVNASGEFLLIDMKYNCDQSSTSFHVILYNEFNYGNQTNSENQIIRHQKSFLDVVFTFKVHGNPSKTLDPEIYPTSLLRHEALWANIRAFFVIKGVCIYCF